MATLLLVRHGETDWNADGRLQGHTDRPLSDFGRRQARQLAEELADESLEAIYASDLARARETAEIVGGRLELPVVLEPDLREKDWGTWEGLTSVSHSSISSRRRSCSRCFKRSSAAGPRHIVSEEMSRSAAGTVSMADAARKDVAV